MGSEGARRTTFAPSLVIAGSLALAALAARWRTPELAALAPGSQLVTGRPALLFAAAMLAAGAAYLLGLRVKAEALGWRHLLAAVAIQLCAFPAPPFTSTDALMNLAYGRMAVLGHNPYTSPPRILPAGDPFRAHLDWPDNPDAWGPVPLAVSALAAGADDQACALAAFKLAMLAAVWLSLAIAFGYCRTLPAGDGAPAFFFFGCNPLLAWELSGQGHNDALLVLSATTFVALAYARRRIAAFLALLAGFLTKYGLAPALGLYWLLQRRESGRRWAIATALAFGVLGGLLLLPPIAGPTLFRGLRIVVPDPTVVVNSFASFASLAETLTATPVFLAWTASGLLFSAVLAACYAWRARSLADVMKDSLSFLLLHQLVVMAHYWPWYATWLLPLALARDNRHQRLTVAVLTAMAPALYLSGAAGGLAILAVHGTALALWWTSAREAPRGGEPQPAP